MSSFSRKEFLIGSAIAGLFALIGAGLFAWGLCYYVNVKSFIARAERTQGTVTGFERWESGSSHISDDMLYAVVKFTTANGQEVRFKGPSKQWASSYKQGDKVEVLYDPKKPEDARIRSFMGLWFAPSILCGIGLAAVFIPLFTLYRHLQSCSKQGS